MEVLFIASGAAGFTKICVDIVKIAFPVRPTWVSPLLALLFGIVFSFLFLIGSGYALTTALMANAVLAGIFAGGGAVGVTELQRKSEE